MSLEIHSARVLWEGAPCLSTARICLAGNWSNYKLVSSMASGVVPVCPPGRQTGCVGRRIEHAAHTSTTVDVDVRYGVREKCIHTYTANFFPGGVVYGIM